MDSKNYAEVLIDGNVYTLAGAEEKSYFQKVAVYINEKIDQLKSQPGFTKQSDDYRNVMVELNIADDYFKAMDKLKAMEAQKTDMEREIYSLKHELVSTQMKLEAALRSLDDFQRKQKGQEEEMKKALSRIKASEELEAAEKEEEEKAAAVTAAFEAAKNAGFIPSASQIPPSQKGGHSSRKGKGKNT